MTKSRITDFSTTPSSNTDLDGVGLTDQDSAKNLRDAMQHLMKLLKNMSNGTAIDDTFKLQNASDTSKTVVFSLGNVETGTNVSLDVDFLNTAQTDLNLTALARNGAYTETYYTSSGTHTFSTNSKYFQIFAVGGGAGGGGVDGQGSNSRAAGSGGGSGFYGHTAVLTKGAITSGSVSIGGGGAGGSGTGGSNGTNGSATTWSDGTNSFSWGGGRQGKGLVADASTYAWAAPANPATATGTIYGSCDFNTAGYITSLSNGGAAGIAQGGPGGCSPYGTGGAGGGGSSNSGGSNATGYGAGGGGGGVSDASTNWPGGDGTAGLLIVREW